MHIIQQFVTQNSFYRSPRLIPVRKLILHSVGCPQPMAAVFASQWQSARYFAHAVLQADGIVLQTMPWNYYVQHVGSANSYSVGVEMTEPDCIQYTGGATFTCFNTARAQEQVAGTYRTAVELFSMLCTDFALNPYTDILSHHEAYLQGIGTGHGDPEHLWRQLGMGYTMDGFRQDVYNKMHGGDSNTDEEDEDMVRYNSIEEMPSYYRKEAQKLVDAGALKGGSNGALNVSEDMIRGAIIGMRYHDAQDKRYATVSEMPKHYRAEAQRLVDRGALQGVGAPGLNVTEDMLRTMIICQRMVDAE